MAREDFDAAPDSGGGGSYEFTITDAYFGISPLYSEKSGRQTLFLHWTGTTDREAQPIMDRDGYHPSWNCGTYKKEDWETLDGGKTAHHPSGVKLFGAQSRVQELYNRVLGKGEFEGQALIPAGHPDDPFEEYTGVEAEAWVGLQFRMEDVDKTISLPNDTGPGRVERTITYVMPVEYLGKAGVSSTPAVAAAPVAAAAAAVAPAAGAPHPNVLKARLIAMAKGADSHGAFTALAIDVDGVSEYPDLLDEVFDEGPAGIYAQAHPA